MRLYKIHKVTTEHYQVQADSQDEAEMMVVNGKTTGPHKITESVNLVEHSVAVDYSI